MDYRFAAFLKKATTVLLLLLTMLFTNASREWVHQFAGHTDTVHSNDHDHNTGLAFEKEHHHCKFLEVPFPVFLQAEAIQWEGRPISLFFLFSQTISRSYHDNVQFRIALRGPPAFSFLF